MTGKSLAIIVGFLILALASTGVAYGLWYQVLDIRVTVNTGTVDIDYSTTPPLIADNETEKDVGQCSADYLLDSTTQDQTDRTLQMTITDGYPDYECWVTFDVHSLGTIPVHVYLPVLYNLPPADQVAVSLETCWALTPRGEAQNQIDASSGNSFVQLHQNDLAYCTVHMTVLQPAAQGATYTFDGYIEGRQFNIDQGTEPLPWSPSQ